MPLYLTPIVGDGTDLNPFRPAVWNKIRDEGWIDLRPDSTVATGRGILYLPTPSADARLMQLADLADDVLPTSIRTRLQNALSLTLGQTRFKEIVAELLTLHAREDGTRWRPLRPTHMGLMELWLGDLGRIHAWRPGSVGASVSETWAGADGTTLTQAAGRDQNWTETLNNSQVVSNKLEPVTTDSRDVVRCDAGVSTDNHKCTATITIATRDTGLRNYFLCCRFAAAADTLYTCGYGRSSVPDDARELSKRVAGAFTLLAGDTTDQGAGATICVVQANGSSISGTVGATSLGPVTDTSIVGNTQGGAQGRVPSAGSPPNLDDWTLEDVGRTTRNTRSWPLGVEIGMGWRMEV